jgi:nucleoside phosphorylase
MTDRTDILIVNALKMELDAAASVLTALGVALEPLEYEGIPCSAGTLPTDSGPRRIVLARPTRMGSLSTATIAAPLVTQLRPTCLAMSGVCAGNPGDVALGDVIIAEIAYAYDEGKRTAKGFEGDHRPVPMADDWLRIAQEILAGGLPSFGTPTERDRRDWLVEQLAFGGDPARHPAFERYLDGERWGILIRALEMEGVVVRKGERFVLTKRGRDEVAARRAYGLAPIAQLPFAIHAGPIASGNVVVKDGVTWPMLTAQGVRTVLGLEMEAAAVAANGLKRSFFLGSA